MTVRCYSLILRRVTAPPSAPPTADAPDRPQVSFVDPSIPVGAVPAADAAARDKPVTAADISSLSAAALLYMERALSGNEPGVTTGQKTQIAQWILEKHTGKPKQEIETTHTLGIAEVINALAALRAAASAPPPPGDEGASITGRDVTPKPEKDPIDRWVEENVPVLGPGDR